MRRNPSPTGPHPAANPAKPGPSSQNRAPRATHHNCQKVYLTLYILNCKAIVMSESSVYTGVPLPHHLEHPHRFSTEKRPEGEGVYPTRPLQPAAHTNPPPSLRPATPRPQSTPPPHRSDSALPDKPG